MKRTLCLLLTAVTLLCLLPLGVLAEEVTSEPTLEPTSEPTAQATTETTIEPATEPSTEATAEPTIEPTTEPTPEVTPKPTDVPTQVLTEVPTQKATEKPVEPTAKPTAEPTADPTGEPTAEPTAEPEEPTPIPTKPLEIDTGYVYEGMDMSYANGYLPKITGGQAIIILPLLGEAQGDVIRVIPEISTDGPFVYGNYQFDIYKTTETAKDAKGKEAQRQVFLVKLALNLSPSRYNGTYPVSFQVQYTDVNGDAQSQSYTLQVTITDGANKSNGGGGGGQQTVRKPVMQLTASAVTPEEVEGEGEILLTVTLQNVGNRDATNLRLTAQSQDSDVLMTSDLNGVFLTGLLMKEEVEGTFTFAVNPRTMAGVHYLTVQATYEDKYGGNYTDAWQFRVNVKQPAELNFDRLKLPESVTSGESFTELLYVYNPSQAPAYKVQATLSVDGLVCASAYLGTIEAQGSAQKEMSIFATTLSGGQRYGESYGMLEISYQDEDGEFFVLTQDLDITIEEPKPITDEEKEKQEQEQKEQQTLSQWWVSLLIAIAAILVLLALIIISKFTRMLKMRG